MNTKAFIFNTLLSVLTYQLSFSQNTQSKGLELKPYTGISLPQGDFKDFSENGSVFGVAIDKYFGDRFALGFDINFQSNRFKKPFNFSGIPSSYNVTESNSGTWNATALTFGPTYKIGTDKFSAEVYSKAGILYVKSPGYKAILNSTDFLKTIFDLPSQERTSFGLTSGVRFNYKVSNKLSLFLNLQYAYSSAKVDYCDCGVEDAFVDGTFNPDNIIDNEPKLKSLNPSYFNLNAGLTWSLGGNSNSNDEETVNRNLPGCMVSLQTPQIECTEGGPKVYIKSEWWGQNANSTISVSVFDGATLVFSGNTISNNNQPLGSTTNSQIHYFNAFGYEGRPLRVEMTIVDQNGVTKCFKDNLILNIPDCQYTATCGWDYNIICDEDTNTIKINLASTWANAPAGSTLDFSITNQNGGGNIPFTSNPNSFPMQISGTGQTINNLFINGFNGASVVLKMKIIGPDGTVLCHQEIDDDFPVCEFTTCEPVLNSASCVNEIPNIDFSVNWTNYPNFANYSIYLDAIDSNGNPVAWFNFPPRPLTAATGTEQYTMNLMQQYAGTTITIRSRVCETGGIKDCCVQKLIIDVPKCCEICSGINDINDTTDVNQTNIIDFVITGVITQSNPIPISKVVAQLEAIKFQPINNNPLTISNFEFTRSWFANGGSQNAISSDVVGSVTGNRSNLIITEINPASATNMAFRLNVGNYNYGRDLRIEFYKVKLTIFKDDGTHCEKFMTYQR